MRNGMLAAAAIAIGAAIAYIDSRPGWDDAGITAGAMFLAAGALAFAAPPRPWLFALAIGISIPLHAIARNQSLASVMMVVVLAFPFAGAYAGAAIRRSLSGTA